MSEPIKKYRQVAYWACNMPDHFHTTKHVAASCIAKHKNCKVKANSQLSIDQRNLNMFLMVLDGKTRIHVAAKFGVSYGYAGAIIRKMRRVMDKEATRGSDCGAGPITENKGTRGFYEACAIKWANRKKLKIN